MFVFFLNDQQQRRFVSRWRISQMDQRAFFVSIGENDDRPWDGNCVHHSWNLFHHDGQKQKPMVISMKRIVPNWIDIYICVCVCLCCPLFSYEHVINKCGSSIFRVIGSHEKSGALQQTQSTQLRKLPGHGCDRFGLSLQSRFGPKLPEPWCCDCLYNDLPEITEIVLGTAGYIMHIYIYTDMMMITMMMMIMMIMMIIVMIIVILIVIIMMTTKTIILMMIITILVTIYN